MEEIKNTLARNLRTYRKRAKLSQEKLGELCGLHRTYIGGIEQQRINVSLKNIGKIALALQINPVFLFMEPDFAESLIVQYEREDESSTASALIPDGYALCTWHGDSMQLDPLYVDDPNLAVSILVALIDRGHIDDLPRTFEAVQQLIADLMQHAEGEAETDAAAEVDTEDEGEEADVVDGTVEDDGESEA